MRKIEVTYQPLGKDTMENALSLLLEQDVEQLWQGKLRGILAIYGRIPVGVLLYRLEGTYILMERIAVSPQYQRMGVGTALLETMGKLAAGLKKNFVFTFVGQSNQNPFYRFVLSTGLFYIERQAGFEAVLVKEDLLKLQKKYPCKEGTCFFDLSSAMQEPFLEQMGRAYPEIADEIRMHPEAYDETLCCCAVSRGQVRAACFVKKHPEELELKLLFSLPGSGVLAAKSLFQSILKLNPEQLMPVRVSLMGDIAVKIIRILCPQYRMENYVYTAYYIGKPEAGR